CYHLRISIVVQRHRSFFYFSSYGDHRDLHSFPTRRSSDLKTNRSCRLAKLAIHSSSSRVKTLPEGLAGEFSTIARVRSVTVRSRSEEHTSELQSLRHLVCRLLLEKKNTHTTNGDSSRSTST